LKKSFISSKSKKIAYNYESEYSMNNVLNNPNPEFLQIKDPKLSKRSDKFNSARNSRKSSRRGSITQNSQKKGTKVLKYSQPSKKQSRKHRPSKRHAQTDRNRKYQNYEDDESSYEPEITNWDNSNILNTSKGRRIPSPERTFEK
jgi:hypothetical protein